MIRSKMRMGILWAIVAIALHLWPGVVKPAHGQGSRKDDIVFNTRGVPLAGATVRVCAMPASGQPCTPLALIYSDAALTQALANPTTSDGLGNYSFYAAPGKYEIEISGPGITTKQLPNVILPSDPSSPTFSSLSSTGGINAFSLSLTGNLTVNGSTNVVGNLASGTLTLSNQGSAPGAASSGTVNLYTKSADKRMYYKDETGTEIGPIAAASGAQTNQANTFTAPQNIDADFHTKGPNPWVDVTRFGGYLGPNYNAPATTCSISAGSAVASCAAASDFQNTHGILILGAGPAPAIATPQAPTVTP
ncbi:MAG TPA: carboxypeptidase-like regulatory domain-containing protein, partial [Candidatus Limnocylindrales bacterium]|nr:carboxypeptidase-like regulatory domain-containing protein [Candidatus Limnocylindrales bacterium]